MLKHANQWVAWSADGAHLVAHADDLQEVVRQVEAAGLRRCDVVFDVMPSADELQ
jgi:hypothetical protein